VDISDWRGTVRGPAVQIGGGAAAVLSLFRGILAIQARVPVVAPGSSVSVIVVVITAALECVPVEKAIPTEK
jgi:hypothetical protein